MKILIAADMEGISGVVHWDHVNPSHAEYPRFRKIMTADVNAAVRGAYDGGAEEVLVADGHAHARNILVEELDPRCSLNSGSPSPLAMVQGIGPDINGVLFVGYHARAGTQYAILEHTWSDARVAGLWVNGEPFGEIGLNASVCGHFGVPVLMISGDQAACDEAVSLLGSPEIAVVKRASGRMAAECLPPEVAQRLIQTAAATAVTRLVHGKAPGSLKVETPVKIEVDFVHSQMADVAALLPGAVRTGRRISYTAPDMATAYAGFRSLVTLAATS